MSPTLLLFIIALLPAVLFCIYIYKKDRAEKEPIRLLIFLIFLGIIITLPAGFIEEITTPAITGFFANFGVETDGGVFLSRIGYILYQLTYNIFGIGLVEEGLKWIVLFLATRKNKNFNSLFDGLIYAVFVSIGFAAFENIGYVFTADDFASCLTIAVMRFITAVPGHVFFAVFMGYCYSMWHIYEAAQKCESKFVTHGLITMKGEHLDGGKWLILSIVIPTLVHGVYDFLASDVFSAVFFYIFVIALYITGFIYVSSLSKKDGSDYDLSLDITIKKYPELKEIFTNINEARAKAAQASSQPGTAPASPAGSAAPRAPISIVLSDNKGSSVPVSGTAPITSKNVVNDSLFPDKKNRFVVKFDE